jgi:SAM-dependent methyltransferase
MPTHQSLSGSTDEDLLRRMVDTHADRFGEAFWAFFDSAVTPVLPPRPVVIDLGCGPALFLRDVGHRHPSAVLHGYDVTPAMVEYGRGLPGSSLHLAVHDVTTLPLPHAESSVDLVAMSSVLHVVDEPLPVLAEIRRVLAPGGVFLLQDWVRQPLSVYLAWRRDVLGEPAAVAARRGYRLFPVHNKYTPDDWRWLLAEAGLVVRNETALRASHRIFVGGLATPGV